MAHMKLQKIIMSFFCLRCYSGFSHKILASEQGIFPSLSAANWCLLARPSINLTSCSGHTAPHSDLSDHRSFPHAVPSAEDAIPLAYFTNPYLSCKTPPLLRGSLERVRTLSAQRPPTTKMVNVTICIFICTHPPTNGAVFPTHSWKPEGRDRACWWREQTSKCQSFWATFSRPGLKILVK